MCVPNDYLRVFMFWFVRECIVPGNFVFCWVLVLDHSFSVCTLRERGCISKSVYVGVFHDFELLR